jgi:hypothetical protein
LLGKTCLEKIDGKLTGFAWFKNHGNSGNN